MKWMHRGVVAASAALLSYGAVAAQDAAQDAALRDANTVREAQSRLRDHGLENPASGGSVPPERETPRRGERPMY